MTPETPERWADRLIKINRAERPGQTFTDFVDLAFHALAKGAWMMQGLPADHERPEAHEEAYMRVVRRYESRGQLDFIRAMPEFFAPLYQQMPSGGIDFLGRAAGHIETLNKFMGQFFTPYDVCRLMAAIQIEDVKGFIGERGFFTLEEPAAGAGAMILAAADYVEEAGFNVPTSIYVEARDLSDLAFKMCFIQLSLRGVAAHVIRGNTLSGVPDEFVMESVPTPAHAVFRMKHGHPFRDQLKATPSEPEPPEPPEAPTIPTEPTSEPEARFTVQLDLFSNDEEVA